MLLPDGPKSPELWQMLQWIASPFSFMRDCKRRYGDCFTVALSAKLSRIVFVSDPEALQVILTGDNSELFDAPGELNATVEPLLGAQSVIGLSGDRHRRMRQLLMPPFHGERMRSYGLLIQEITQEVMIEGAAKPAVPVRKLMQTISMRVILRAVFGLDGGPRYRRLETLLGSMLDKMNNLFVVSFLFFPVLRQNLGPLSPWGNFIRNREEIDQLIYDEIRERRSHPDTSRNDILTMLLAARDESGEPLTELELRDELMTLLVAGHETTATALTWALYWVQKLPPVRHQLLEELRSLDGILNPAAISRLPYLNAVCSETLRIYPVGMLTFPRVTRSRLELNGFTLEPGTVVVGCIYLAHRREDLYPDAEEFRPDRFLERRYSPFEYLPFGGGVRRCIGLAFAQFEMKLVLSGILSGFELELLDHRPVRVVRRGLTAGPSPFQMAVKKYRPEVSSATVV
jgi:cytochrome P450 family 110